MSLSRTKVALLSWSLLLSTIAGGADWAFAQGRPASARARSSAKVHTQVTESSVDSSIPNDASVDKMLEIYSPKVRALDLFIGKLKGDLRKGGIGAGSLGNFVTDGIRAEASLKLGKPIVLAITNAGGLRKNVIAEGDLKQRDIFELLPFENSLVAFDLTGSQVLDLLRIVVARRDAQSGARISYRIDSEKKTELQTARLLIEGSEKEIDPGAIYTVISIDYLLKVAGGDYSAILKEAKNTHPLGLTLRDAITQYVKSETVAGREIKSLFDGRFVFDKAASGGIEEPQP